MKGAGKSVVSIFGLREETGNIGQDCNGREIDASFWVSTVIYTPLVQVDTNSKRSWSTVAFRDTPGCWSVTLEQYVHRIRVYANPMCRSPLLLPAVQFRALCPRPLVAEEHPT